MITPRTRQQLRRPAVVTGAVVGLVIIVAAAAAPLLTPYDLEWADLSTVLTGPSAAHPLGGDGAGRDVLSRLLYGARASLVGAVIGASFSLAIGVVTGLLAGYFGRRVDVVLGWVFNLVMALPAIIVVLAYVAVAGPGMTGTMLLVGGLLSPIVFRIVRGATHRVRSEAYVDAARVSGLSELRIVRRHVLRVIGPVVIVQAPLLFGVMLLVQAGIDYIGLGDAGSPSWGAMLNDASVNVLRAPLLSLWPGAAIAITVLAVTLVGNAVRDGLEAAVVTAPRRKAAPAIDARPGRPGTALLTIDDLAITHATPNGEVTVVDGVSLEIRRGEVLGLVGESGSGKSQTVLAALGLLPASGRVSGGQVWFDGVELTGASERTRNAIRGRRIGYVSQEPMSNLDPSFRVGSQLMEPLRVHLGLSKRQARVNVLELLASVGITDPERVFRLYPHEISGGMAQRVLIAGAVSCDPELLVADEPTTALDVTVQAEVLDLLRTMRLEREMAILLVTHDLAVVADICDRATVLRGGAVVESAPVTALFTAPEQDYTAALLAADPHNAAGAAVPLALHEPLLEVDRLRVEYPGKGWRGTPHVVLEQVSLAVDAGETLGLVGESGSGKTTLGRAVLGLVPVSGGDIRHGGRSIAHLTRAERRAGVRDIQAVFQDPFSSLNPSMRIQDILVEPLLVDRDITKARAAAKVGDLLDRVRLPAGIGERRAAELSGGQRQRVAIARALALDPRLIVCDEPVSALDVSTQAQVLELLAEIQRDTGVAYLFISHDLAVVRQISHRVAVMARGDIVESGDAVQVTTQPHHEYTRRLLLSAPVPDPARQAERRAARLATMSSRRETG